MIDIYFIRHAESEMNDKWSHLIGGRSNEAHLTEKGNSQAKLLGKRLKEREDSFDEVYTSISNRAIETAKQAGFNEERIIKASEIVELSQGDWELKPKKEVYTDDLIKEINKDNWNFTPPNGESQRNVEERMLKWVKEKLFPRYDQDPKIAVFTHGVAIKCLLRGIMDFRSPMTRKVDLENTSITRLKYDEEGWHVISVNDTSHLD